MRRDIRKPYLCGVPLDDMLRLNFGKATVRKPDDWRTPRKRYDAALFGWAGRARRCPGFPYAGQFPITLRGPYTTTSRPNGDGNTARVGGALVITVPP
jgi:hypothetical protein